MTNKKFKQTPEYQSVGFIPLGDLRNFMKKLEDKPDDTQITFEFMCGSFFPNIMNNVYDELKRENVRGFKDGYEAAKNEY